MIKIFRLTVLFVFIPFLFSQSTFRSKAFQLQDSCLSKDEMKLYKLIMDYRKQKKLPSIPLSSSLTYVAKVHAQDLFDNKPEKGDCNTHSWSDKGKWTPCCYTPDHAKASCMWDKPRELTTYTGNGYEIAYWYSKDVIPELALKSWQGSKGHNPVIINQGVWKNQKWKAIGIGIYKNYACVWFGTEEDQNGKPKVCP